MDQHILEDAMRIALAESRLALANGDFPYGAVVLSPNGAVVARAQDTVARYHDLTRHAEIDAVRAATAVVGSDLSGCALVSNVEPCAMCTTAAWWAKIALIAYGLSQAELYAIRPDSMEEVGLSIEEAIRPFARKIKVVPGVLHAECAAVWNQPKK